MKKIVQEIWTLKNLKVFVTKLGGKNVAVVINVWDDTECGRYWSNYTHIYVPEKWYKKSKESRRAMF